MSSDIRKFYDSKFFETLSTDDDYFMTLAAYGPANTVTLIMEVDALDHSIEIDRGAVVDLRDALTKWLDSH